MREMVSVQTNDPKQPVLTLIITGKVEKFVDIRPAQVRLAGQAGPSLAVEVEILKKNDYPFAILGVQAKRNDFVRAELLGPCDSSTNRCVIRVENLKATSGRYAETIIIRTDNAVKPSFPIPVVGIIN
jgi:hypothetical protein